MKQRILVADDNDMLRAMLVFLLEDLYEMEEAEDGKQVVEILEKKGDEIDLLLLDLVMPGMNGLEVLDYMKKNRIIDFIPVIMISAEEGEDFIQKAYELGATDYIKKPYNEAIVKQRVANTLALFAKQNTLMHMVTEQMVEKERSNQMMVSLLGNVVEFRNGESGLHVIHINTMTEILLRHFSERYPEYHLNAEKISQICTASSLHDIGKLAIPDEILNKPGRFTDEEFQIMKGHSAAGAKMLDDILHVEDQPVLKYARDICMWHHERYDGRGYPERLKGDQIPIYAQVVSIADVYDALTSERVYKAAYSHEKAMDMIRNGECGTFNPKLLEILEEVQDEVQEKMQLNILENNSHHRIRSSAQDLFDFADMKVRSSVSREWGGRTFDYIGFLGKMEEVLLQYDRKADVMTCIVPEAMDFGLPENIQSPASNEQVIRFIGKETIARLTDEINMASPEKPDRLVRFTAEIDDKVRNVVMYVKTMWTEPENEVSRTTGWMASCITAEEKPGYIAEE
ncbi:MAG: response regulator [Eubacterium sp.]|nr:response regulator [Eubacterium sp.]